MRLALIIPVFNDWASFQVLLRQLNATFNDAQHALTVYAVNDGSTLPTPDLQQYAEASPNLDRLVLVDLALNMGHQRAIAIGLCLAIQDDADCTLVMDSDGEDAPEDIPKLITRAHESPSAIVVARRVRRQEGRVFRAAYVLYRALFRIFVGKPIRFGNFSLLSVESAKRIVLMPELWNNLATAFLRSRLPVVQVPLNRGRRYAGRSQMNFTSLISHGFSAISAYAETIFVRLLLASLLLMALTTAAVITTVSLRLFVPRLATPGWATTVSFGMVIVLLQVAFVTLTSMLTLFNSRVQSQVIPLRDYAIFVARRTVYRAASTDGRDALR